MGKDKLVDMTKQVHPLTVPTSMSPFTVTNRRPGDLGFLPIGVYKGQAAFWDLDKAVNQPLVGAEKAHILGILDGREEGYDLATATHPIAAAVGTTVNASLTVPSGLVFFVHAIHVAHELDATAGTHVNFRVSIWPSREDPVNENGQPFWATDKETAAAAALDELIGFYTGAIGTGWGEAALDTDELIWTNKDVSLRLSAGAKVRVNSTVITAAATAAIPVTLALYGYVGKLLVA